MYRWLLTILALACVLLAGCATTQQVVDHDPQTVLAEVRPDNWVEVVTLDGEEMGFWVTEVSEQGIAGAEGLRKQGRKHFVAYEDISVLTVRRPDGQATAIGWGIGILLLPMLAPAPALPLGTL